MTSLSSTHAARSLLQQGQPLLPAYSQIYRFFTTLKLSSSSTPSSTREGKGRRVDIEGRPYTRIGRGANSIASTSNSKRLINSPPNLNFGSRYYSQQSHDSPRPSDSIPIPNPTSTAISANKLPIHPTYLNSLPLSLRRLAVNLPAPPGRPPSQAALLGLTNSFMERLRIRFKWATIRSYRRFRPDDYSAFVSLGITGIVTWILISVTSFVAVGFAIINSLSLQEKIARMLGNYLTSSTGVTVVFESAIVPKWGFAGGGSSIVFKNVYISRGGNGEADSLVLLPPVKDEDLEEDAIVSEISKWTHFHLSIDTVEVSLDMSRWLDGKGLVKDANVTGVRGVVDRSHVYYDPDALYDRMAYRHVARPGDFWLESLQIEDFLVTVYQPDNFRPYTFSIFNADIRKLRKQWLFYDLLSADSITGQVDNCLFSLHKPQSIGRTSEEDLKDARWGRMSRFRVDGVPIDHMQTTNDKGALSWITSGRCDLVADIRFPLEESAGDLSTIVADIVEIFDKEIGNHIQVNVGPLPLVGDEEKTRIPGQRVLKGDALEAPKEWGKDMRVAGRREKNATRVLSSDKAENDKLLEEEGEEEEVIEEIKRKKEADRMVLIDLDIRFKDLKATVPIFTTNFSYVNNALIRPIVAFLNSNRTLIPIRCHFDLSLDEFDGSWTTYDCGLLDRTSEQVYAALAHHVQVANNQRIQTVSLWTLRLTAEAVLSFCKRGWNEVENNGTFLY